MDTDWAILELRSFIDLCRRHDETWERTRSSSPEFRALDDEIVGETQIIERIADRAWADWRQSLPGRGPMSWKYEPLLQIAKQTLALLERQVELDEKLGDPGPTMAAGSLHPDVWQAAQGLWRSGHFGDAVKAAARSVNAMLQAKVGRRDASDAKLVGDSFSLKAAAAGQPRLRLMDDDGSETYTSLHEGAAALGRGCFMAFRNVLSHEYGDVAEPPEQFALEYLAAFSVLARWIEDATLHHA